jgi:hypothetical protein
MEPLIYGWQAMEMHTWFSQLITYINKCGAVWKLEMAIIAFIQLMKSHTDQCLGQALLHVFNHIGAEKKVSYPVHMTYPSLPVIVAIRLGTLHVTMQLTMMR